MSACVTKSQHQINDYFHECERTGEPYVFARVKGKYAKVEMDLIAQPYVLTPDRRELRRSGAGVSLR